MRSSSKRGAPPAGGADAPRPDAAFAAGEPLPRWSEADAERHLRSLELFGMRFGLDRMRRMMTALDSPQARFDSIHIVGTNGKTSTARMLAAILERHGLFTGTYSSPHLISYRERVQVRERDIGGDAFAGAVARAAWAAGHVNRTLAGDDHVTQFELLTAAAFCAMAAAGVQVGVVEAGLGGRYDATSVIDSHATVLTNVALEHTRWLGPTLRDIAEEKLAVVKADSALILGAGLAAPAVDVAMRVAAERNARIVRADDAGSNLPRLRARGGFQRDNFALARLAAQVYLEGRGMALGETAVTEAAQQTAVAGRLQVVDEDPLTLLDGAHNPHAAGALVDSLADVLGARPLALVLGVLEDKDAARMLERLLPISERAWFTAPPSARALSPAALQSRARQLGFGAVECEPRPGEALLAAQRWARERGGAVLATGSVYLVGELLRLFAQAPAGRSRPGVGASGMLS
jgi:dihydrofolate synthase/folylpolyglutamate synthase